LLLFDAGFMGPHISACTNSSFYDTLYRLLLGIDSLCCLPIRHVVQTFAQAAGEGRPESKPLTIVLD